MNIKKIIIIIIICYLISGFYISFIDKNEQVISSMKIISLSPAATEILYEIGSEDLIIGVSSYCDYPIEAINKKKMGSFEAPDIEKIFLNNPDIVFLDSNIQISIISQLQNLGIKIISLNAKTFEDILQNIKIIGQVTSNEYNSLNLCKQMNEICSEIYLKVKYCDHKPTIFFEVWDNPLMCAGSETFIYHVILISGGKNIINLNIKDYSRYNLEVLIYNNPEIYVINSHNNIDNITNRLEYNNIQSIFNKNIFIIDENIISRPGPRIIIGIESISNILHPELFL